MRNFIIFMMISNFCFTTSKILFVFAFHQLDYNVSWCGICMHAHSVFLTLCNPMDYSLPGSSVHGIFQSRILEWVAILYSRGSFQSRDRTGVSCVSCISCTGSLILYNCATWEAFLMWYSLATGSSLSFLDAYICVFYKVLEAFGHYKNFHGSVNQYPLLLPSPSSFLMIRNSFVIGFIADCYLFVAIFSFFLKFFPFKKMYYYFLVCHFLGQLAFQINLQSLPQNLVSQLIGLLCGEQTKFGLVNRLFFPSGILNLSFMI